MAKALGIGGVFFKARDPKQLATWYETWLGIEIDPAFTGTVFRAEALPDNAYAIWSPFEESTTYFEPSKAPYMINLIVDDLSGALDQVAKGGATSVAGPTSRSTARSAGSSTPRATRSNSGSRNRRPGWPMPEGHRAPLTGRAPGLPWQKLEARVCDEGNRLRIEPYRFART